MFFLVKLKIHSSSNAAGLFRCLGSRVDLVGVRVIQEVDGGNAYMAIESTNKGFIRIRPFAASWRTGLDKQDPFFRNKKLAALELEKITTSIIFAISSASRISIVEYDYRAYDSTNDYTWNARIHLVDAPTSQTVLNIENFSIFSKVLSAALRRNIPAEVRMVEGTEVPPAPTTVLGANSALANFIK